MYDQPPVGEDSRGIIALVLGILGLVMIFPICCCGGYGGCCLLPVQVIFGAAAGWLGYSVKQEADMGMTGGDPALPMVGMVLGGLDLVLALGVLVLYAVVLVLYFFMVVAAQL